MGSDGAVAGLKFYSDAQQYLIGSGEETFDSGLQTVEGNIVGIQYERNDTFDFVGLILSEIQDEEAAAALRASQEAKAELMAEYNDALACAANAENQGDAQAAADCDD